jgi:hypothetical protein
MSFLAQRTKRVLIKHSATKTIRGANGESWTGRLNGMLCCFTSENSDGSDGYDFWWAVLWT